LCHRDDHGRSPVLSAPKTLTGVESIPARKAGPWQLLFLIKIRERREILGMIKTARGDIDFTRAVIPFVGQGSPARRAEAPPCGGVRAISRWTASFPEQVRLVHRDPCHRLRAHR